MRIEDRVRAAQSGDQAALREVGTWLSSTLRRVFRRSFPISDVDELVQQTSEKILEKLDRFEDRGPLSFRKWVLRAAGLKAKDIRREWHREHARQQKLLNLPRTPNASPGTVLDERIRKELVHWCLQQLPDHYRRALMHWLEGGDTHEFAKREGISTATVATRCHRAREQMRVLLEEVGLTPSQI